MRQAIKQLNHIIEGHFYVHEKQDLSVILNTTDMLEVVKSLDIARYEDATINYEGEYHIVSSVVKGDTKFFFVEDVRTTDGILKYDETDILIIPNYLPLELKDHFANQGGYEKLIALYEDTTFEDLAIQFKN
jgi:hypothetical protein